MPPSTALQFLLALALIGHCVADVFELPEQLRGNSYDYVVVGAGTAGNVIAARLAEDGKHDVLVLEAGLSNEGVLGSQVPFFAPTLTPNTPYDWNYTYAPQPNLNGRSIPIPRGRLLGGSSSVNYMVHHYGSSDDYDLLAKLTGDAGWSWDSMKRYIKRHEKFVPPADGHDTTGQYIPSLHSTTGVLPKSLPGVQFPIDDRVIETTKELSSEFPFNQDTTSGNVLGMGWAQSSIGGGKRSSSATTYLAGVVGRRNIDVLLHAQVTKLVRTGAAGDKLAFRGVEFASGPQATRNTVYARKEVIVSAGSIGTPQILQLSGIGDKAELSHHSITTHVHNPSVGKNLSDHVLLPNPFNVRGSESLDDLLRNPAATNAALEQWQANKTGVLVHGLTNQLGFFRFPDTAPIFNRVEDPATGPTASHWEMIISNYWLVPGVALPPTGNYLTAITALISPTSRGDVKLSSNDPLDHPLINPNLLSSEFDKYAMRESVRAIYRFLGSKAWADYILSPVYLGDNPTDAEIDDYIRDFAGTVFHPVGTSAMSPAKADWGVVDPQLRVKGVDGVRVVDASVWPFLPNAHTQGPTYLVAERAATLIRGY